MFLEKAFLRIVEKFVINSSEEAYYLVTIAYARKPTGPFFEPTTHFQLVVSEINITCTMLFKNRFQKVKN